MGRRRITGRVKGIAAFAGALFALALLPAAAPAALTPLTQYGTGVRGSAPGQLNATGGVAIDSAGNVYAADDGNNRIDIFAPAGPFSRSFPDAAGPANVNGVAVDAAGNAYVTEFAAGKVNVYNSAGTVIGSAGTGNGTTAGKLKSPYGPVLDSAGNIYVAERDNQRISKFSPSGQFLFALGYDVTPGGSTGLETCTTSCQAGTVGAGAGQLTDPQGIAVASNGDIYVGDFTNDRIEVYSSAGAFLRTIGASGSAAGQITHPIGIALDSAGNVYVADSFNSRIDEFTGSGGFVRAFGWDVIPGGSTGFETCTVATTCKQGAFGDGAGEFSTTSAVAFDCRGAIYVSDFGTSTAGVNADRIQRFGEPGTPLPPCTAAKASNDFKLGKLKRNKRNGTAKLAVTVPGPGNLALTSKGARSPGLIADDAQTAHLTIKPKGKSKKGLRNRGRAPVRITVTYTPDGGDPASQNERIVLRKKLPRK